MASFSKIKTDYQFISEPDDENKCVICLEVAREPFQHEECGKLLCKECLEKHGMYRPCPHCRRRGSRYYKDNKSECLVQCSSKDFTAHLSIRQEIYSSSCCEMCQHGEGV